MNNNIDKCEELIICKHNKKQRMFREKWAVRPRNYYPAKQGFYISSWST